MEAWKKHMEEHIAMREGSSQFNPTVLLGKSNPKSQSTSPRKEIGKLVLKE